MRWLELLVAGIFTYDATHSAFLVAVVTVARTLPMLFIGAIAGLVGEAFNRKRILLTQLAGLGREFRRSLRARAVRLVAGLACRDGRHRQRHRVDRGDGGTPAYDRRSRAE